MILVTGAAGFIGFHLALALLDRGEKVLGVDSLNDYYAPKLKEERLRILKTHRNADRFYFQVVDISENEVIQKIFSNNNAGLPKIKLVSGLKVLPKILICLFSEFSIIKFASHSD